MRRELPSGILTVLGCLLMVVGAVSAAPVYPVKKGPTGRYLVDQNGVPFLIAGESPQAMIGNLSEADAELFFANRRAHGFNTVWINLLCATYTGCRPDGSTFDGIRPFTVANDLSTPNEAYFVRADRILRLAARYGLLVILDPAETGSWLDVMRSNGAVKCREYGRLLGQRYASFDNLLWMHGNDYTGGNPTDDALVAAIASGIREFDTKHLHTFELYRNMTSLDIEQFVPLSDLDAAYTFDLPYVDVLRAYNRPNFLPTFLVEGSYEFEQNSAALPPGIPQVLRRQIYWSILSGATGQLWGNKFTWQFLDGWKNQLDTPGAVQMANVKTLFEPRKWYELVPDQIHSVVTAGYGTFGSADYVTTGRTPNGSLVMAYVPTVRTVTVDMTTLSGVVTARWYDPAAGMFTNIPGSPFANVGSRSFSTPGTNADGPGNEDWVVVLETVLPPLSLSLSLNQSTFLAGQTLTATAALTSSGVSGLVADLYLGALLPDRVTIAFYTSTGGFALGSLSDLRSFQPFATGVSLTSPSFTPGPRVSYQWNGTEPKGDYVFFQLALKAGALADGVASGDEILALTTAPFSLP